MFLHVSFLMVPSLCFSTILLSAGLGHKNSLKIDLENGRTYGMLQSPDHVWLHLRRVASRHVPGHLHCHLCRHRCCCWLSSHMPLGKCLCSLLFSGWRNITCQGSLSFWKALRPGGYNWAVDHNAQWRVSGAFNARGKWRNPDYVSWHRFKITNQREPSVCITHGHLWDPLRTSETLTMENATFVLNFQSSTLLFSPKAKLRIERWRQEAHTHNFQKLSKLYSFPIKANSSHLHLGLVKLSHSSNAFNWRAYEGRGKRCLHRGCGSFGWDASWCETQTAMIQQSVLWMR